MFCLNSVLCSFGTTNAKQFQKTFGFVLDQSGDYEIAMLSKNLRLD